VVILPALVVAEQIGISLPAVPALLGVGALAAHGRGSITLVLGAIAIVALAVDFAWYELGRRRGASVLTRLCRLSLDPDSCVRRSESVFARFGARGMLVAKFVPGLTTVMPRQNFACGGFSCWHRGHRIEASRRRGSQGSKRSLHGNRGPCTSHDPTHGTGPARQL
jgi:hypothetical protein